MLGLKLIHFSKGAPGVHLVTTYLQQLYYLHRVQCSYIRPSPTKSTRTNIYLHYCRQCSRDPLCEVPVGVHGIVNLPVQEIWVVDRKDLKDETYLIHMKIQAKRLSLAFFIWQFRAQKQLASRDGGAYHFHHLNIEIAILYTIVLIWVSIFDTM